MSVPVKRFLATLVFVAGLTGAVMFFQRGESGRAPSSHGTGIEQARENANRAVAGYVPAVPGRIDDLTVRAVQLLQKLPGVIGIEVPSLTGPRTARIIHLKDWHFVSKEMFATDLRDQSDAISNEEIDSQYEAFLQHVEAVQIEQTTLLRCLIQHHGLKQVFSEGLTDSYQPKYLDTIAKLRRMETEIPEMQEQQRKVSDLIQRVEKAGKDASEQKAIQQETQAEIDELAREQRMDLLRIGAAGRLLVAGELDEVLPLDDAEALEQANPVTADEKIKFDEARVTARRDAMVKRVLDHGPFGLIVLGGSHDLAGNVGRIGGGTCEYIAVTTEKLSEFASAAPSAGKSP